MRNKGEEEEEDLMYTGTNSELSTHQKGGRLKDAIKKKQAVMITTKPALQQSV